jgi:hypothetical protein
LNWSHFKRLFKVLTNFKEMARRQTAEKKKKEKNTIGFSRKLTHFKYSSNTDLLKHRTLKLYMNGMVSCCIE